MMKFYSTKSPSIKVNLKEAVLEGLAQDGGLFMPSAIPLLPESFWLRFPVLSFQEMACEVAKALLGEEVSGSEIRKMVESAINFDVPLVPIQDHIYSLELFHGPTLAFKDFGARFMAKLMAYFLNKDQKQITILVATSGDTGSAVGQGFHNVAGINVVLLYPYGKVSEIQEKQLTTIGDNITALEVEGTFDDCQRMVKEAFMDTELKKKMHLSSANSINIARLIPQSFYYFWAYAKWQKKVVAIKPSHLEEVVVSVPCGNFGNLTAGIIAKRMGLPISKFIAATNVNDVVPNYFVTGEFKPRASIKTISSAMDVGNPSNFERIKALYEGDLSKIKKDIVSYSFTDDETKAAINEVWKNDGYFMDPHGAVAYLGLKKYAEERPNKTHGIFLETAHPAKFAEVVEPIINKQLEMPESLARCLKKKKRAKVIGAQFKDLKNFLLKT